MSTATLNGNGKGAHVEAPVRIELSPLSVSTLEIPIRGLTPLICHKWSEKAMKEMRDKQAGKAKAKKEPKDPEAEFEAARYRLDDGRDGFPAVGFKAAIVGAARDFDNLTMVNLKRWIFIHGEVAGQDMLVPLTYGAMSMREDAVRVGMGTADLRYRPQYDDWSATLKVDFPERLISADSILALIEAAGFGGIGEWRPSSPKGNTGVYGRFVLAQDGAR